jgi:hypothetical protein
MIEETDEDRADREKMLDGVEASFYRHEGERMGVRPISRGLEARFEQEPLPPRSTPLPITPERQTLLEDEIERICHEAWVEEQSPDRQLARRILCIPRIAAALRQLEVVENPRYQPNYKPESSDAR